LFYAPNFQKIDSPIPGLSLDLSGAIDFYKLKAFNAKGVELYEFRRVSSHCWLVDKDRVPRSFTPLSLKTAVALEELYVSWLGKQIVQ
jgi:hypothetical protein